MLCSAIPILNISNNLQHSIEKHQVAEYIPTPLAELERLKREEKKRNKKKEKEKELAEQLKEKTKKSPSKRLHEDDIHFLFEVGFLCAFLFRMCFPNVRCCWSGGAFSYDMG